MMAQHKLTHHFFEPLNGVVEASINIQAADGNLQVDRIPIGNDALAESTLIKGTLEYFDKQDIPTYSLEVNGQQAAFSLQGEQMRKPWFRLPWKTCNGATDWQVHLNPDVSININALSGGGNLSVDLGGMSVQHAVVDTGGGNVDVILPDRMAESSLSARTGGGNMSVIIGSTIKGVNSVDASSGAGNVNLVIPDGVAARIQATTGLGKVIMDPRFERVGENTYQDPGYEVSADKVKITTHSGAGNVTVTTRQDTAVIF